MNEAAGSTETADGTRAGRGRRGDTRARIQQVALELFAEQGYERTSLREIAERLDVTKAALYYHFKSKEDIVFSFTEDYFTEFDDLIAWARQQPPGSAARLEIVERYMDIVQRGSEVFRFLERNQAAMRGIEGGKQRFDQFRPRFAALVELLAGPDASLRSRVRATVALMSINFGWMFFSHDLGLTAEPADPDELRAAVLDIASGLAQQAGDS
jgi:AcrR family transcriptional regulator